MQHQTIKWKRKIKIITQISRITAADQSAAVTFEEFSFSHLKNFRRLRVGNARIYQV